MGLLIRGAIVALGVVTMLGGLASIILVPEVGVAGLWTVGIGAFLVIVPLIERNRYRSEAAEKRNESPGPGGGSSISSARSISALVWSQSPRCCAAFRRQSW